MSFPDPSHGEEGSGCVAIYELRYTSVSMPSWRDQSDSLIYFIPLGQLTYRNALPPRGSGNETKWPDSLGSIRCL